jgi:hypothetical protein
MPFTANLKTAGPSWYTKCSLFTTLSIDEGLADPPDFIYK